MTLLILLATFSLGSGQAVLHLESLEACHAMQARLEGYAQKFRSYSPFGFTFVSYCVPEQP